MKNIAAFFDIDGTLYRDSLMIEHFKKLIKYEVIDERVWLDYGRDTFNDWDTRQGNYDDYMYKVSDLYVEYITNLDIDVIEFAARQVMRLKADRIYRYTRERIHWHLTQGHKVIFISGSPNFIVDKMAKKYGATDYKGADYIFEDGKFTGDITPMWGAKNKDRAIDEFKKKYNLDLEASFSYGDTNGDFIMLKRVGNPVTINPTKELLQNIKKDDEMREKIDIVVERKDIIYHLDLDSIYIE